MPEHSSRYLPVRSPLSTAHSACTLPPTQSITVHHVGSPAHSRSFGHTLCNKLPATCLLTCMPLLQVSAHSTVPVKPLHKATSNHAVCNCRTPLHMATGIPRCQSNNTCSPLASSAPCAASGLATAWTTTRQLPLVGNVPMSSCILGTATASPKKLIQCMHAYMHAYPNHPAAPLACRTAAINLLAITCRTL